MLEVAIQENTAAINNLIALLSQGGSLAQAPVAHSNSVSNTDEAQQQASPEVAVKKPAKSSAKPVSEGTTAAVGVTYDDAAQAVQALAKEKGREAAIAVLNAFNAKTLKDVNESDFAAVKAACEAA